jgi:hypothetical protein
VYESHQGCRCSYLIRMTRVDIVAVFSFGNRLAVVAALVLLQVVHPCEAILAFAVAPRSWAVDELLLMG